MGSLWPPSRSCCIALILFMIASRLFLVAISKSQKSMGFHGWKKAPSRKEPPSGNDILRTKKKVSKKSHPQEGHKFRKEKSHLNREKSHSYSNSKRAINKCS